jgi:hypothetical protein
VTRAPVRPVTGRLLVAGTLLMGALIAVPMVAGPTSSPTPAPAQSASAAVVPVSRTSAESQYSVLAQEDHRLLTLISSVRPGSGPYVETLAGVDTLVLTATGLPYDLGALRALGATAVLEGGNVLLTTNILVAPGARLVLDAPGTTLRMRSGRSGFVSLVAWKADLVLSGAEGAPLRVSGWDVDAAGPDTVVEDGRAYIREVSGDMRLTHVGASYLGFWAGRTSGVAWTGSSRFPATGLADDSSFLANHYGAFASQAHNLSVTNSSFTANVVDGLSLHRSTAATSIRSSAAYANGRHGFSADLGSETVTFRDVTAGGNAVQGIYFSGRPLSEGRSAGGAPVRTYGDVAIHGGRLHDNGGAGLRVVEAHRVSVTGTRAAGNRDGIALGDTAASTRVADTVVTGSHRLGITATGGSATVSGNRVEGGLTGIRVQDAAVKVTGNHVTGATRHAISVIGAAKDSSLVDNTIAGRGPSGLDTFRLDPELSLIQTGNDVEGWTRDRNNWEYWSTFIPNHPMLLLWVIVLGLPLALGHRARKRPTPLGTAPYRDDFRRERRPPLRVDVATRGGAA